MKTVSLDYSPLRSAVGGLGETKKAGSLGDRIRIARNQLDISARFRALQDQERAAGKQDRIFRGVLGIVQAGTQVADAVTGIIEQGLFEDSKKKAFDAQTQLKEKARNTEMIPEKDENGNTVYRFPKELKDFYDQKVKEGKEKYSFSSKVTSFYNDLLNQAFDSVSTDMLNQAKVKEVRNRDELFLNNVNKTIQLSIANGDYEGLATQGQISSSTFISDTEKKLLTDKSMQAIRQGIDTNMLVNEVKKSGTLSAQDMFSSLSGRYSPEQQRLIQGAMAAADKETYETTLIKAESDYTTLTTDRQENGRTIKGVSPALAIKGIESTWKGREEDKTQIIDELRKKQSITEWDRAFDKYTGIVDNLDALMKARKGYMDGGSEYYRFDGLKGDELKRVQEMFDRQIDKLTLEAKGSDKDINQQMFFVKEAFRTNRPMLGSGKPLSAEAAVSCLYGLVDQGGSPEQAAKHISSILGGDKIGYEDIIPEYMKGMKGLSDQQKDPFEKSRIDGLAQRNMLMAAGMIGEGASAKDVRNALKESVNIETLRGVDKTIREVLDTGIVDAWTDEGGLGQHAKLKQFLQTGRGDSLVYKDSAGNLRYTRSEVGLEQAMAREPQILRDMGIPIKDGGSSYTKEKSGDYAANFVHEGFDGNKYMLRTDDGKTMYPAKLVNGEWVKVAGNVSTKDEVETQKYNASKQAAAAKKVEEHKEQAKEWVGQLDKMGIVERMEKINYWKRTGSITNDDLKTAGYVLEKGRWVKKTTAGGIR